MAGHEGKGESVWLTQALITACRSWAPICRRMGRDDVADRYEAEADRSAGAVNRIAWNGSWYARGVTDAGRLFGTKGEREGRMYVNPQAWALIAGIADEKRTATAIRSVNRELMTPWGPHLLAPAYTKMREDIGRICQKSPGYAENGSVYCHGALFYVHGLYAAGRGQEAWDVLSRLMPSDTPKAIRARRQLPLYIPSLWHGQPMGHMAGTTNKYFRTGSCAWYQLVAGHFLGGCRGEIDGLRIDPQLPAEWKRMSIKRRFRGATYHIRIRRQTGLERTEIRLDGQLQDSNRLPLPTAGREYNVDVRIG
jgi:cellobionic acid phosphorylase